MASLNRMACKCGCEPPDESSPVQSPGLQQVDFEELIGREMTVKVLEAMEDKDRLILSNRKTAFETNKKLSYTVRLAPPLAPHSTVPPLESAHPARPRFSDRAYSLRRVLLYMYIAPRHEART